MKLRRWLAVVVVKFLSHIVCRIGAEQLARIPQRGPLLIAMNHVNILEIPIMYTQLYPRPFTGFVRDDAWQTPLWRFLLNTCDAIPIRRGEPDLEAVRRGLAALENGSIVMIAPEGTRSRDGRMQRAHPGIVLVALRSGAPILPVAFHGSERLRENLRQLRRTDFLIEVGHPFHLDAGGAPVTRELRRKMVDEIMYKIAVLLPPRYRGAYADLEAATEDYLVPASIGDLEA